MEDIHYAQNQTCEPQEPYIEISGDIEYEVRTEEPTQVALVRFEVYGLTDDTSPEPIRVSVVVAAPHRRDDLSLVQAEKLLSERILHLYRELERNPPHQRAHSDPFSPL